MVHHNQQHPWKSHVWKCPKEWSKKTYGRAAWQPSCADPDQSHACGMHLGHSLASTWHPFLVPFLVVWKNKRQNMNCDFPVSKSATVATAAHIFAQSQCRHRVQFVLDVHSGSVHLAEKFGQVQSGSMKKKVNLNGAQWVKQQLFGGQTSNGSTLAPSGNQTWIFENYQS